MVCRFNEFQKNPNKKEHEEIYHDLSMFRIFQLLPYFVKKHSETNKANQPLLRHVSLDSNRASMDLCCQQGNWPRQMNHGKDVCNQFHSLRNDNKTCLRTACGITKNMTVYHVFQWINNGYGYIYIYVYMYIIYMYVNNIFTYR